MANAQKHVFRAVFPPYLVVIAQKSYSLLCKKPKVFLWNFLQNFFNVGHRHEIIHDDGVH